MTTTPPATTPTCTITSFIATLIYSARKYAVFSELFMSTLNPTFILFMYSLYLCICIFPCNYCYHPYLIISFNLIFFAHAIQLTYYGFQCLLNSVIRKQSWFIGFCFVLITMYLTQLDDND